MMISIPTAAIGSCSEFTDNTGLLSSKTVVISPLRITVLDSEFESCKVSFGCNLWKSCQNHACSYCQAGMRFDG